MYGTASAYLGNGRMLGIDKADRTRPKMSAVRFEEMLHDAGTTRADFEKPEQWKGEAGAHHLLSALSWVRYVHDLRKHFGVRYFLALGSSIDMHRFVGVVLKERERKATVNA